MEVREQKIKSIKDEMQEALERLRHGDLMKNRAVNKYLFEVYRDKSSDVSFAELSHIPKNEALPLPTTKGGVILTKNITSDDGGRVLHFKTVWTNGATLIKHYHGDADEIVKAVKGCFEFIVENPKSNEVQNFILQEGNIITIGAGWHHQITSLKREGELDIEFIKI